MTTDEAYYVGIHRHSFKAGIPARIIGVKFVSPNEGRKRRLCYHVQWSDKTEDWVPVEDHGNYKIISFDDILTRNIPEVNDWIRKI